MAWECKVARPNENRGEAKVITTEEGQVTNLGTLFNTEEVTAQILVERRHKDAIMPKKGTEEAAGYDLYTVEDQILEA